MEPKFAILNYAKTTEEMIPNKKILALKNKRLNEWYIKKHMPFKIASCVNLNTEGIQVLLPITEELAESDSQLKDEVYSRVLQILREYGVRAVKGISGSKYPYDGIIPAASGFYILPFVLPLFLKKASKLLGKGLDEIEIVIIDGIADLTVDILCIISQEINYISVLTEKKDFFDGVAQKLYEDSGINIQVADNAGALSIKSGDIIFNASEKPDKLANHFKGGVIYFDLAGNSKKTRDLTVRRSDIAVFDGLEFKTNEGYIDNILLEAICLSTNDSFRRYVKGNFNDDDFNEILDFVDSIGLSITVLLNSGKRVK